jgi:hypothetical protein
LIGAKSFSAEVNDDALSSERFGANYYAKLRDLLAAKDWKAADQETADRMFEVMDRQKEGWLDFADIEQFPCRDLRNIDSLWVKYSQGRFGFSVQKKIWESCGSPSSFNKDWKRFCAIVGWRYLSVLGLYFKLSYSDLNFDLSAPPRHLPLRNLSGNASISLLRVFSSRIETCKL